jgi:hypothetical protein
MMSCAKIASGLAVRTSVLAVESKPYFRSLHWLLHDEASAVHCATQDPDSPQFCAHEKLFELQVAIHSANVRVCASRILPMNAAALPDAIADESTKSATRYFML